MSESGVQDNPDVLRPAIDNPRRAGGQARTGNRSHAKQAIGRSWEGAPGPAASRLPAQVIRRRIWLPPAARSTSPASTFKIASCS